MAPVTGSGGAAGKKLVAVKSTSIWLTCDGIAPYLKQANSSLDEYVACDKVIDSASAASGG